jgi:hypothetical protein
MVKFENPEVDAKYEACRETDGKVHIPAGKSKAGENKVGYSGPLSKITPAAAEKALASGSNILKLKEVVEEKISKLRSVSSNNTDSTLT